MTRDPVFELRIDPTTGRKVLIAEGRALRPFDFERELASAEHSAKDCPFCRGNEHQTPHELAVVNDAQGEWQVRVVPNKYPAVASDEIPLPCREGLGEGFQQSEITAPLSVQYAPPLTSPQSTGEGDLFGTTLPHGIHEVIIESPRHVCDWSELSVDELALVLTMFRDRLRAAFEQPNIRYGLIFKNVGQVAGASLEHVHSQLIALPFVPEVLECELRTATEYHAKHGKCLMCELLAAENKHGERLVIENEHFAAVTAYAGRQPYETWLVPKLHSASFLDITNEMSQSLAAVLRDMVTRLASVLTPLAYNLVLHTAPLDTALLDAAPLDDGRSAAFHWHWELIPRSTSLAGFEWATGMHINSVSPERAALRLRASNSSEKLPIQ
jgi:UDPglucose--hexose-1-phosphate uridylyltransferase